MLPHTPKRPLVCGTVEDLHVTHSRKVLKITIVPSRKIGEIREELRDCVAGALAEDGLMSLNGCRERGARRLMSGGSD